MVKKVIYIKLLLFLKQLVRKLKRTIYVAFAVLVCLIINMKIASASTAVIKLDPSTLQVDSPGQEFTVEVIIENVENMALWQIYIEFNPEILECLNASIPSENIFKNKVVIAPDPQIDNTAGTVLYGASVFPMVGVSGSGTLCEIKFKSKAEGISPLHIVTYDEEGEKTFCSKLEDPEGNRIQYTTIDGEITVIPENIATVFIPALVLATIAILLSKRKAPKS